MPKTPKTYVARSRETRPLIDWLYERQESAHAAMFKVDIRSDEYRKHKADYIKATDALELAWTYVSCRQAESAQEDKADGTGSSERMAQR